MLKKVYISLCLVFAFNANAQNCCDIYLVIKGEFESDSKTIIEADLPSLNTFNEIGFNQKSLSKYIFKNQLKFQTSYSQLDGKYCENFDLEKFVKKYESLKVKVHFKTNFEALAEKTLWIPISEIDFDINVEDNIAILDLGIINVK